MPYVLPQTLVHQDFTVTPQSQSDVLRAHISGPHAQLIRFSDPDERPLGELGLYDPFVDTAYDFPERAAGAVVDQDYVKLFMKDALLNYHNSTSGLTKLSSNKVTSDATIFATGNDYDRAASLYDRDVKVGDVAKVSFVVSSVSYVLWTYVAALEAVQSASDVGDASADDANEATVGSPAFTGTKIGGPTNAIDIDSGDSTGFAGYHIGSTSETYTIVVTQGSTGGDATTARLRVISSTGRDDADNVTPGDFGQPTAIGAAGGTVTFDAIGGPTASESATDTGIPVADFVIGQKWRVTFTNTFTATTATAAGTYDGDVDTTYVVTVTKGGAWADEPKVTISTTTGVDISGPVAVEDNTDFAVGTHGVTMKLTTSDGLMYGDRFYVTVTAAADAQIRTIVLGHSLDAAIPDATEGSISLYIRKPELEISKNRTGFAPLVNFELSDTQITVKSGIEVYDESWTDDGEPLSLPVSAGEAENGYGTLYVEYRAWRSDLCSTINGISDVGELNDAISGPLHPDNPLKWAVFKALENSNGVEVKYTSVCNPDSDEAWADVLELLLGKDNVYSLVPLTRRRTVLDLYAAHVDAQSSPEAGLWRTAWFNLEGIPEIPVVTAGSTVPGYLEATTSDGDVCLATVLDDPDADDTQYTIVTVPDNNGKFLKNGVRAGDIVRLNYTGDGFGNYTYSEYVVDKVITENQLRLLTGPADPISVESKIEIWRTLSATEEAAAIAKSAGSWGNRRIRAVWPDRIESSGTIQEGYHVAAALAGLASGVNPHQGLTNLEIAGFTDVSRTVAKFNKPQLDAIAGAGGWIVTQDDTTGLVFTRHALTTGDYNDLNMREEMITRNGDSISYRFKTQFAPFIGVANVTPVILSLLRAEVLNLVEVLKTEKNTRLLGGQLIEADITELRTHLILKDRIVLNLDVTMPAPFNNFEIHLVI